MSLPSDEPPPPKGRDAIVVIGIDDYAGWPKLHNAVADARGVDALFVDRLGFERIVPPLLDGEATRDAILHLLRDALPKLLEPDDSLILFFAGHGHNQKCMVGGTAIETGYLAPVEARAERLGDLIDIESFLRDAAALPARHVLVILDSCHSGMALGSAVSAVRSVLPPYVADLERRRSRKVITSARGDETAADGGPVPGHSMFTGMLIEGLGRGLADHDDNGIVTSLELGLYLEQRVGAATDSRQTPDFGAFYLDDRGEMAISIDGDHGFAVARAQAIALLQLGPLAGLRKLAAEMAALRPDSPATLYVQYRSAILDADVATAERAIDQLCVSNASFERDHVPFARGDLDRIGGRLLCYRPVLALPEEDVALDITVLTGPTRDRLSPAPRAAEGEHEPYLIGPGAAVQVRVRNTDPSATAWIYEVAISAVGVLRIGPLLNKGPAAIEGLLPGAEGAGPIFCVDPIPGLWELRVLRSPSLCMPLLVVHNTMQVSFNPLTAAEIAGIRRQSVWLRVVAPAPR
ncbi:MAG: caspase family protein [Minicystis sp.]